MCLCLWTRAAELDAGPTLPFNLISRSHAKEAGLKVAEESVTIHTLRGREIKVHATLIPRFTHRWTTYAARHDRLRVRRQGLLLSGNALPGGRRVRLPAMEAMGSVTVTTATGFTWTLASRCPRWKELTSEWRRAFLSRWRPGDFGAGRIRRVRTKPWRERMFAIDAAGSRPI